MTEVQMQDAFQSLKDQDLINRFWLIEVKWNKISSDNIQTEIDALRLRMNNIFNTVCEITFNYENSIYSVKIPYTE